MGLDHMRDSIKCRLPTPMTSWHAWSMLVRINVGHPSTPDLRIGCRDTLWSNACPTACFEHVRTQVVLYLVPLSLSTLLFTPFLLSRLLSILDLLLEVSLGKSIPFHGNSIKQNSDLSTIGPFHESRPRLRASRTSTVLRTI